jgi:O-antigen/teichoic acid export membrane protein
LSRRRIALGLAANVYDKLLIAGIQLLMVPMLVLHWGLHLYGCWLVLATIPSFLALADMGFGGAAYLRMIALVAQDKRDAAVVVLQTACQVVAIASVVVLILALLVIYSVPGGWLPSDPALSAGDARTVLAVLVLYALAVFQKMLQGAGYASVQLAPLFSLTAAHVVLLENALLVAAVLAGYGPVVGAAALVTGRIVGTLCQWLLLRRRAPWLRFGIARADAAERRILARSAVGMIAIPLSAATALQGSVLALSAAAGPVAAPAFVAARTLSRIGLQATQLLTHALMPEFTAAHARGDRNGQAGMLLAVVGAAAFAALPFALLIGLGGDWILALWTKGMVTAPPGLMPAIALSVAFGGLWPPLSNLMLSIDRHGSFAWPYLALATLSVAATYLLGRSFGATGAALALAGLDACMCLVVGRFAVKTWLHGLPLGTVARAQMAAVQGRVFGRSGKG